MSSSCSTNPLEAIDPILGPLSHAHAQSGSQQVCLALLARAQRENIPPKTVKLWITSRLKASRPDVIEVAGSPLWAHLVKASDRWMKQQLAEGSSSLPPRAARRGLARVLAENSKDEKRSQTGKPASAIRLARLRHAAAVICLEAVRVGHAGKDTVIISDPWLSVQRGIDQGVAGSQRRLLVELGWMRLVAGGRRGIPARLRFTRLPATVGSIVEGEEMYSTVGQIARQDEPTDLVAALFCSANHPAWNYTDELGPLHWLIALADAAGVDPEGLGILKRRIPPIRKELFVLLGDPAERTAESIRTTLDDLAITTGAFTAFEEAEERRRARAELRRQEVLSIQAEKRAAAEAKVLAKEDEKRVARLAKEEAKAVAKNDQPAEVAPAPADPAVSREEAIKQQAARLMPMLYGKVGSLPQPAGGVEVLRNWIYSATPLLAECQAPLRTAIAHLLFADAKRAGWDAGTAGSLAKTASMAGEAPAQQAA